MLVISVAMESEVFGVRNGIIRVPKDLEKLRTINDDDVCLVITGIGKVNAALTLSAICATRLPAVVVNIGFCAGLSEEIKLRDIILPKAAVQYDFGHFELGKMRIVRAGYPTIRSKLHKSQPIDFLYNKELCRRLSNFAEKKFAEGHTRWKAVKLLATGDMFVVDKRKSSEICKLSGCQALDMEGAAVSQVCNSWGVPCAAVKIVSDMATGRAVKQYLIAIRNSDRLLSECINTVVEWWVQNGSKDYKTKEA